MSDSSLTQARLKEVMHYNRTTGVFTRLDSNRRIRVGGLDYVRIRIGERRFLAHRLAWLYVTGVWPDVLVDHKNGVRSDNRWRNLRAATHAENQQNQTRPRQANSLIGAHWNLAKQKFSSAIRIDGRLRHLGYFPTASAAHKAYVQAKRAHHTFNTL